MCMHTHVTRGSIHCGDTCERNLHFQLNCWPLLQNATLDSAPSSPARLLLLRQPLGARWKRLLHHAHEKPWSQQNYLCVFYYSYHYYFDTCIENYLWHSWTLHQLLWQNPSTGLKLSLGQGFGCRPACDTDCHSCAKLEESMSHNRSCYVKWGKSLVS